MTPQLTDIPGIGRRTAERLAEAGYPTVQSVADATAVALEQVFGIGPAMAPALGERAAVALQRQLAAAGSEGAEGKRKSKSKKRRKKGGKKGKKQDKKTKKTEKNKKKGKGGKKKDGKKGKKKGKKK